jgi:hypothetical protein
MRDRQMRTTSGRTHGKLLCFGLGACLLLQGCVSGTEFARPGTDARQQKADESACVNYSPAVTGVVGGGALGALAGAGIAATGGGTGPAVLVGLLIAGAFGAAAAIIEDGEGEVYDRCMEAKGYHPV